MSRRASVVFPVARINGEIKVVLIKEPQKPLPHWWKGPGGGNEDEETPEACAVRELSEETGLRIKESDLIRVDEAYTPQHLRTFFRARLTSFDGLNGKDKVGNDGEISHAFSVAEVAQMIRLGKVHPGHTSSLLTTIEEEMRLA